VAELGWPGPACFGLGWVLVPCIVVGGQQACFGLVLVLAQCKVVT